MRGAQAPGGAGEKAGGGLPSEPELLHRVSCCGTRNRRFALALIDARRLFSRTEMPPPTLKSPPSQSVSPSNGGADSNKLAPADRPAHDWYRFVLSYPPHLVREYLQRFDATARTTVLDPFCGTGTTVVECKKHGIPSVGIEAHPMSHFASLTKTDWAVSPKRLRDVARRIADEAHEALDNDRIFDEPNPLLFREGHALAVLRTLPAEPMKLLLTDSISARPLHKVLVLIEAINRHATPSVAGPLRLGLARALVSTISNLHFGPEVGIGPAKEDSPVVSAWQDRIELIARDLDALRPHDATPSEVYYADSRKLPSILRNRSIEAVITSPPYPNEKDYTRTTRLESVLLGFIQSKAELQALKRTKLLRSNTRNVYKGDEDHKWVAGHAEVQRIAREIEERRIDLGKTSGFERLYATVTKLYFGGMARHLSDLRTRLVPGARLAYVVGDQASYLRIMIRTGNILASIAEELGYVVEGIDLFRTRLATATREQLREEVLVLRWPGK